jgi:hypothetical protein
MRVAYSVGDEPLVQTVDSGLNLLITFADLPDLVQLVVRHAFLLRFLLKESELIFRRHWQCLWHGFSRRPTRPLYQQILLLKYSSGSF